MAVDATDLTIKACDSLSSAAVAKGAFSEGSFLTAAGLSWSSAAGVALTCAGDARLAVGAGCGADEGGFLFARWKTDVESKLEGMRSF